MAENKFKVKFEVIHFLDSIRWEKTSGYYLINYAYPNQNDSFELTEDEKLLTHWISYITDRQMPFQQIWDKGGLVFSEIAHRYHEEKNFKFLTDFNQNFRLVEDDDRKGYEFVSSVSFNQLLPLQTKRLESYYTHEELERAKKETVEITFKSRFYTDDFLCLLYTLHVW